jgi:exosortase family protein XrtF
LTVGVAERTEQVLEWLGFQSEVVQSDTELSMNLIVRDVFVARIIEGCNAISIIILFIAFVVGFAGKAKTTILFIISGSILIYTANILRIAAITIGLYKLPDYQHLLHDFLFPTLIYGLIFLLWIIWIKFFYINKK